MINTDKQKESSLLLKLKDEPSTSTSQPYTLQKIFQRFEKSSKQNITLQDLQETSTKIIHLKEKITYQKWHINITIIIQDSFKLQITALIDSGPQMNCIQEGLIPPKYFEKTKQRLSTTNDENLVKFKVTNVNICNKGICIKQSFILIKDFDIEIILGQSFLEIIKPFKIKTKGITTKIFQQKILFAFNKKTYYQRH
ncbi:hypothetical protein CFOL_v3_34656 [Cephalotus follicularis]|uniref:Retropepsins domain-containing protein n=1 Tax=Cephalotus follicularis TaxID=3775 RepID=A0A1Q3DFJ6_CEPFO|nr:hypothetical protein CFOL_v3_34656 [Cephalotus follicularis]